MFYCFGCEYFTEQNSNTLTRDYVIQISIRIYRCFKYVVMLSNTILDFEKEVIIQKKLYKGIMVSIQND